MNELDKGKQQLDEAQKEVAGRFADLEALRRELAVSKERSDAVERDFTRRHTEAEARLKEAELRIHLLDKVAWVCGVVGVIFGISGGWGLAMLHYASENIGTVQKKVENFDAVVKEGIEEVKKQETKSIANVQARHEEMVKKLQEEDFPALHLQLVTAANSQVERLKQSGDQLFASKNDFKQLTDGALNIKCQKLTVTDGAGKTAIELTAGKEGISRPGFGGIRMYDDEGKNRVVLGTGRGKDAKAFIYILDDYNSGGGISINQTENGGGLTIIGKGGSKAIEMNVAKEKGQEQSGDMMAIRVCVHDQDDFPIAQATQIKLVANASANG
jgi:uncharacterized membrane-anchored protein YhcB (DUF1043 family)